MFSVVNCKVEQLKNDFKILFFNLSAGGRVNKRTY